MQTNQQKQVIRLRSGISLNKPDSSIESKENKPLILQYRFDIVKVLQDQAIREMLSGPSYE